MQGIDIRLRWSCPRANGGGDAYRDEDAHFARRQAFGLDDIDSSTHYVEHAAKTLFLMWVTLTEHKWVTLGERRGSRGAGISWPLRRSEARRSSTWHSVPTATGRGLGWSWWWRRTYALNSGVARKSIACRSCHHQGLKPHSFHGSARLKPCPDTNQIITSCSRKCRNSRAGLRPALEFLHFGTDFLTVPPRIDQAEAHALYQGMASAVPLEAVNSGL